MSDETLGMEIVATLSDKTAGGIASISTGIKQIGQSAVDAGKNLHDGLASSVDQLGPAFDRVGGALPGVSEGIGGISTALRGLMANPVIALTTAVVGATAALGAFAVSQADSIHHLSLLSQQTGLTVSELGGLKKAGAESGLSVEQISNAALKLETSLGKASKGLKALGVDAKDPVDAMAQVANKFDAANSQSQRAAIGMAAFGKSWKDMTPLLQEGGKALKDAAEASHIDQDTIDAYNSLHEALRQIQLVWVSTEKTISAAVAGPIAGMAESFLAAYRAVVNVGDGMGSIEGIAHGIAGDIGTVVELLGDAAVIAKTGLLMALNTVENVGLTLVKTVSSLGVQFSHILELTGHGKGMESFFQSGYNWAVKTSDELDHGLIKQVDTLEAHLSGAGDRLRKIWAEPEHTPERKKKLSGGGGEDSEAKAKNDEEAKYEEQAAAFRSKLAIENAEQLRQIQAKAGIAAIKQTKESRQGEIEIYDITFFEEQRKYAGNAEALKALQQTYRSEIASINRKWDDKDAEEKQKGLKKFSEVEAKKSEAAQRELEKQEKAYDKTWGRIANTTASSMATMITTHGSMTARIEAAETALYNGLINDAAQWLTETMEDMIKRAVLSDTLRTADQAKAAAAATEAAAQAQLTGAALANAYSSAAAMASVATMGAADVTGAAALTATVAAAKGLALAGGGMNFGGAVVGDGGKPEYSNPTVPQRITQTSATTINHNSGGNSVVNIYAGTRNVAAVMPRASAMSSRSMWRESLPR